MTSVTMNDLTAAIADHRSDPHGHPELLQLRQAVTSAGIPFNPADATQLHTAIEQTVDVAADAAMVTHMIDPAGHAELKQVRQVVTSTGMAFEPGVATQLHTAIDQMIETNLVAGVAVHAADPFAHPEQKQVRTVITDAGMVYDPEDVSQLSDAITHMVDSYLPLEASETARGVTRLATVEEARDGVLNTVAVHPAGLKAIVDALTSQLSAHPGVAQAAAHCSVVNGVLSVDWSFGITSVTRLGNGYFRVAFAQPFASSAYVTLANVGTIGPDRYSMWQPAVQTATEAQLMTTTVGPSTQPADPQTLSFAFYGPLA